MILSLTSTFALTGCSKKDNGESKENTQTATTQTEVQKSGDNAIAGTKGTITFVHPDANPVLAKAVTMYNKTHEGIKVKEQSIPYGDYTTWLKAQLTAGTAPEVMFVEQANEYKALDLIISLNDQFSKPNPYSESGKPWEEDFTKPYIDISKDPAGNKNMVPWSCFVLGVFYNKDAFDKAGITPPKTWEEWKQVNEKLKQAYPEKVPWAMAVKPDDAQTDWLLSQMLSAMLRDRYPEINLRHAEGWQFDINNPSSVAGEVITPDEKLVAFKKGILDPAKNPAIAEAHRLVKEMVPYWGKDYLSLSGNEALTNFLNGDALQYYNGTWLVSQIFKHQQDLKNDNKADKVFNWGMYPIPQLKSNQYLKAGDVQQLTGLRNGYAIKKIEDETKAKIALDFVQYITSPKIAAELFGLKNPQTNFPYISDMALINGVNPDPVMAQFTPSLTYPDMAIGRMVYSQSSYDQEDFDQFISDWQLYLSNELSEADFLKKRSESNLNAINRLIETYQDQVDQKWMDEKLQQIK